MPAWRFPSSRPGAVLHGYASADIDVSGGDGWTRNSFRQRRVRMDGQQRCSLDHADHSCQRQRERKRRFHRCREYFPAGRVGSVTVGSATLTVNQAGAPCTVSINPTSRSVTATGGNVNVGFSGTRMPVDGNEPRLVCDDYGWCERHRERDCHAERRPEHGDRANRNGNDRRSDVYGEPGVRVFDQPNIPRGRRGPAHGAERARHDDQRCAWTATSNASWLTIRSGASGNGTGDVTFDVAANPGGVRTGTLTIADQTLLVTQQGQ